MLKYVRFRLINKHLNRGDNPAILNFLWEKLYANIFDIMKWSDTQEWR